MNILCRIAGHKLSACECKRCGNQYHIYSSVGNCLKKCTSCGDEIKTGIRSTDHKLEHISGKCIEKCSICGKEYADHKFKHVSGKCIEKCSICGKEIEAPRDHKFEYVSGKCIAKCSICGKEIEGQHQYKPNYDSKTGDSYWVSEKCSVCGKEHEYDTLSSNDRALMEQKAKDCETYHTMDPYNEGRGASG